MNASVTIRKAAKDDCKVIHDLIRELAVFEKAPNEVVTTPAQLQDDAFGEKPIVEMWVAERNEEIIGTALIFEKYSTWMSMDSIFGGQHDISADAFCNAILKNLGNNFVGEPTAVMLHRSIFERFGKFNSNFIPSGTFKL